MSLKNWKDNGWIREHRTSRQETTNLFAIVERDLSDAASTQLSADWRFGIAYNAALKLCTILLFARGYRPEKSLAHFRTIQSLPLILGESKKADTDYLDMCRIKRNTVEYDMAGAATPADAEELIGFARELLADVRTWLASHRPELL